MISNPLREFEYPGTYMDADLESRRAVPNFSRRSDPNRSSVCDDKLTSVISSGVSMRLYVCGATDM